MSDRLGNGPGFRLEPPLISVVDDDPSILRSLRALLLSSGLRVRTFKSGKEFLASGDLAETSCLILDLNMPNMSGSDLVSHLAATGQAVAAIVFTAVGDQEVREQLLRKGVVACLQKPVTGPELLSSVLAAVGRQR